MGTIIDAAPPPPPTPVKLATAGHVFNFKKGFSPRKQKKSLSPLVPGFTNCYANTEKMVTWWLAAPITPVSSHRHGVLRHFGPIKFEFTAAVIDSIESARIHGVVSMSDKSQFMKHKKKRRRIQRC